MRTFGKRNWVTILFIKLVKNLKTIGLFAKTYTQATTPLYKEGLQIKFIYHKNINFRISDSMNDFILTPIIEFSIKSYVFHIL